ncbi:MAG: hypothetical protein BWY09_01897 [Candidatus Hydrogenedentes bacterium ADurb.Bin179]|nr:MAG: hypothetical protein BWY09_01897 [Candidatus Hydrogenedentes bacterium ADurb.Bin179]
MVAALIPRRPEGQIVGRVITQVVPIARFLIVLAKAPVLALIPDAPPQVIPIVTPARVIAIGVIRHIDIIVLTGFVCSPAGHFSKVVRPFIGINGDRGRHAQRISINSSRADGAANMGRVVNFQTVVLHDHASPEFLMGGVYRTAIPDPGNKARAIQIIGSGIARQVGRGGYSRVHVMGNMVQGSPIRHLH